MRVATSHRMGDKWPHTLLLGWWFKKLRFLFVKLGFLAAILVSAWDLWLEDVKPLAKSISQQVSGETTAWLVGGDVVVINVASSPFYREAQAELEFLSTETWDELNACGRRMVLAKTITKKAFFVCNWQRMSEVSASSA